MAVMFVYVDKDQDRDPDLDQDLNLDQDTDLDQDPDQDQTPKLDLDKYLDLDPDPDLPHLCLLPLIIIPPNVGYCACIKDMHTFSAFLERLHTPSLQFLI
jgi:hypothetical protein